ncbi:MAG: asparagine synthase-related protein [Pseudomonadota bacterium]
MYTADLDCPDPQLLVYAAAMGAIGAIFQRDGVADSGEIISRMASALRVHGPLRHQHRQIGPASMAWSMLSEFTPEDRHDRQPLISDELAFCFTGRLHFRKDIASKLGVEPKRAEALADGALAFRAWQKWGKEALDQLEGQFALLAYSESDQTLVAARSPYAAPPLVYHQRQNRFAVASMPSALFALHDIPKELDEQRIADSLVLNNQDTGTTFYVGIDALPSGHWIEASPHGVSVRRYYNFEAVEPLRLARDDDYVDAANALLRDAVEDSMHSETAPAFMVSSGLDSSSVAVTAIESAKRGSVSHTSPLLGFTSIPESGWDGRAYGKGRAGDESGPVRALMAKYPELQVEFIDSAGLPIDEDMDRLLRLSEAPPYGWNNNFWGVAIHRRSKELGRNVMIGGQSGNRTLSFSNRALFPSLLKSGRLKELHGHMRGYRQDKSLLNRYLVFALRPLLPRQIMKSWSRFRGDMTGVGWRGFSAIDPDYAHDMNIEQRMEELGWDDSYTVRSPREMMVKMTSGGTRELGAFAQQAHRTMHGIENRDPLGYKRLSEFCAAIPMDQFMHNGRDRWLIKRMMQGRLPEEIINAPRGRQAADWHLRMTRDLPRYRAEVERMADDPDLAKRFDVARLRRVMDTWPDKTPIGPDDHPDYSIAMLGLGRAIATSRFINIAKGKNT